jgi:hypothetical protein
MVADEFQVFTLFIGDAVPFSSFISKNAARDSGRANVRGCNEKFPDWVGNEIYAYNNKHSLISNTRGHGKTH